MTAAAGNIVPNHRAGPAEKPCGCGNALRVAGLSYCPACLVERGRARRLRKKAAR